MDKEQIEACLEKYRLIYNDIMTVEEYHQLSSKISSCIHDGFSRDKSGNMECQVLLRSYDYLCEIIVKILYKGNYIVATLGSSSDDKINTIIDFYPLNVKIIPSEDSDNETYTEDSNYEYSDTE